MNVDDDDCGRKYHLADQLLGRRPLDQERVKLLHRNGGKSKSGQIPPLVAAAAIDALRPKQIPAKPAIRRIPQKPF